MNINNKTIKFVTAAMLAALTCIATMIIRVPTIGTNGYVNIGDTIVLISAWLMGFPYGALAAGIGSGLADLLAGYAAYVPGTTIIKFAMAFAAYKLYSMLYAKKLPRVASYVISSIIAELVMIIGYFVYEAVVLGYGMAAAASIPSNAIQGITCLVLGNALINALNGARYFKTNFIR